MRYLVTGGAGFIGSHLVDALLDSGYEVVVLDNLSTGNFSNISRHRNKKNFLFHEGDILDYSLVSSLVHSCDRVLHFAAAVGVLNILTDPIGSMKVNVLGTENVLDACRSSKKPILIASSSEIYGKNKAQKLSEGSDRIIGSPQKIRWSYSDAKSLDEAMTLAANRLEGLETRVVRLFNTVGPRQVGRYGMVVPRFVQAALEGKPLNIYGSGFQTRCFGHVEDIVRGILLIEQSPVVIGTPVNVGVDTETSIIDLAHLVISQTSSRSKIEYKDYETAYPEGFEDMERRVPDNSLLRNATQWQPTRNLVDIIDDLVSWFKEK